MTAARLRDHYERKALAFDEVGATYESASPYRRWYFGRRRDLVLAALRPRRRDLVLDVGCGPGAYANEIRVRTGMHAVGIDVAHGYLVQAGSRCVRVARADATDLPFKRATFDAVLATEVLEHMVDDAGAVREVARVLRPGGRAVFTAPNRRSLLDLGHRVKASVRRYAVREHLRSYLRDDFAAMLRRSFGIVSVWSVGHLLPYPLDIAAERLRAWPVACVDWIEAAFDYALSHAGGTLVAITRNPWATN